MHLKTFFFFFSSYESNCLFMIHGSLTPFMLSFSFFSLCFWQVLILLFGHINTAIKKWRMRVCYSFLILKMLVLFIDHLAYLIYFIYYNLSFESNEISALSFIFRSLLFYCYRRSWGIIKENICMLAWLFIQKFY